MIRACISVASDLEKKQQENVWPNRIIIFQLKIDIHDGSLRIRVYWKKMHSFIFHNGSRNGVSFS